MARETPPTRTSPPHLAKAKSTTAHSAGLARSGASTLARSGAASARSTSSMMGSESASGSYLNLLAAAKPPQYEASEDKDEDDDDDGSEMIIGNLFPQGPGVAETGGVGDEYGEDGEEQEGSGEDDNLDFTNIDDADSVPNAEVNKYSFVEHLHHYMDGNKISDANRKCVEWTILFEVGTLVRNMDTMRIADMEASIFSKYVNIVHDIEDKHFESNSVRLKMQRRFKAGKQDLCGRNLFRRWKSETANPIVLVQISGSPSDV